ncbi:MAG: hypothetical protein WC373_17360, partial [Smithella sp.]
TPDIYGGKNCDEHIPQWRVYAEGDMDHDVMLEPLVLRPDAFPPGTQIIISEPFCPDCGMRHNECCCGFDWKAWAEEKYS